MSAPIEPQDYLYGVKVVQIEDLRVARGLTRRPCSSCRHVKLVYDHNERRIWCSDCEADIEAFDAFENLVSRFSAAAGKLKSRETSLAEAEQFQARSRAAKVMDEAWRSTKTAPLCPHCNTAILPEDIVGGVAKASKSIVLAARKRKIEK